MLMRLVAAVRNRLELASHDDFTIAEYLRALGAHIGEDCRIQVRELGSEPWLITIGRHVTIGADVAFVTHDGSTWVFTEEIPSLQRFGPIEVKDNCFIGFRATLMPGVTVGPNAVVGTGAIVTEDVPEGAVVAGIPARQIGTIEDLRRKQIAVWESQRPPGYLAELDDGARHSPRTIARHKREGMGALRSHLSALFARR